MQLVLFNPLIGLYQVLPLRARVDLGAMVMKGFSAFSKAPASLERQHQIVWCHILDTHGGGGLTSLQRCSQYILQPQPTGQEIIYIYIYIYICCKKKKKGRKIQIN